MWGGVGFDPFAGAFSGAGRGPAEDKSGSHVAIEPDAADGGNGEESGGDAGRKPGDESSFECEAGTDEPPDVECEDQAAGTVIDADDLIGTTIGELVCGDGGDRDDADNGDGGYGGAKGLEVGHLRDCPVKKSAGAAGWLGSSGV